MNLSPLDIRKHEFKRALRGYDVEEVAAFLDMVSMEYEQLSTRNMILEEKVQGYEGQLKKYHDIESTLQETLLSAERAREDTVKSAKKQAEVIIREAEVNAAAAVEDSRHTVSELRGIINQLKVQKESYITKLTALANAQVQLFASVNFDDEEKLDATEDVFIRTEPVQPAAPAPPPAAASAAGAAAASAAGADAFADAPPALDPALDDCDASWTAVPGGVDVADDDEASGDTGGKRVPPRNFNRDAAADQPQDWGLFE